MRKTRLLAAAILLGATIGAAGVAEAIETGDPAPPSQPPSSGQQSQPGTQKSHTRKPKKKNTTGWLEQFYNGYHKAYALIYTDKDYTGGIAALRTLGYDDNPDVATLIGYASRKLGRYDNAKYWYEKALAADPKHALTWSYYGMWQAEQGKRSQGQGRSGKSPRHLRQHHVPGICRPQGRDRRHGDVLS